ncbi:helix-turn-helix transcriptional regulator [Paraburkholderia fungorum]
MFGSVIEKQLPNVRAKVAYQRRERGDADSVTLRLHDYSEGRMILERSISRPDDVSLALLLPLRSERLLQEFAGADPWLNILAPTYETIENECREIFSGKKRLARTSRSVSVDDLFSRMATCDNEFDLAVTLDDLTSSLGAEQYCVSWIEFDGRGDRAEHRYLVGCDPVWMQKYAYRSGYMNDPSLEYAKRNASPTTTTDLQRGAAEHWWFQEAQQHGLCSMLTCPVHEPARARMTVLQVAVGGNRVDGDAVLLRNQRDWISAANVLSAWRLRQLREIATAQFGLVGEEVTVLRALLHWKDSTAETIATELDMRARHVRRVIYPRITQKMGVSHIKEAVTLAFKCGLIT